MRRRVQLLIFAGALAALCPLIAQNGSPQKSEGARAEAKPATPTAQQPDGERVFKQNCARCHDAPQGFPRQVSGTIVRHMRVRASLSAEDVKALMQFMNP
jgi:cytochrome c5